VASEKLSGALFSDNSDVRVRVYKTATVPHTPAIPNSLVRDSLIALAVGLLLGVGSALLMERRGSGA
jgi:capsular polysaccharide biosynthesis protein